MLILHIIIALSSIIFASVALVRPSRAKMHGNYGFIAATTATGVALVATTHVSMLHACMSGLVYLSAVAILTVIAERRLVLRTADELVDR